MRLDDNFYRANEFICKAIEQMNMDNRGWFSQSILGHLRTFVESILYKIYVDNENVDIKFRDVKSAIEILKSNSKVNFICKFHDLLQISASHYTLSEDGSERMMIKYYEYLMKTKKYLMDTYEIDVLSNLEDFPINTDPQLKEFHEKIVGKIGQKSGTKFKSSRYYITKVKPFFVKGQIYYEITFTSPVDYSNKFDRMVAFTNLDILHNYAVKLSVRSEHVLIFGKEIEILIIDDWEVSIRPCEIKNFAKIFGLGNYFEFNHGVYKNLMSYIQQSRLNLLDIVTLPDEKYREFTKEISANEQVNTIRGILTLTRNIIINNYPSSNILRYLLYKMNNVVIKNQYRGESNNQLYGLNLKWGSKPFDVMPFATALVEHNPKLIDLLECIPSKYREHEFLARYIDRIAEQESTIYTPLKSIDQFSDIPKLIEEFNGQVYMKKHENRLLKISKNFIYRKKYEDDAKKIIEKLLELTQEPNVEYTAMIKEWKEIYGHNIDCNKKNEVLDKMFETSKVALVYGAAGTGKTTLINYLASLYENDLKAFLAHTNPAVENLKSRVKTNKGIFSTIRKFNSDSFLNNIKYKLLVLDECSTISNEDFIQVLDNAQFELLVLVGDDYQISSIQFGNWFQYAKEFLPSSTLFHLDVPYRSSDKNLIQLWDKVRNLEEDIQEHMSHNNYSSRFDSSIFNERKTDEIILCLNYDGLYGINNLNRILQSNNNEKMYKWGVYTFKVNDPILFNDSKRFEPALYNNLKGKILDIEIENNSIIFTIEVQKRLTIFDVTNMDFELMPETSNGNSIIKFKVVENDDSDNDVINKETILPFQVSYALSIHKAQGLEFDSVKIVITDEMEELITHDIFYTAITRARKELKIYWSAETETKIISSYKKKRKNKDVHLLKTLLRKKTLK